MICSCEMDSEDDGVNLLGGGSRWNSFDSELIGSAGMIADGCISAEL